MLGPTNDRQDCQGLLLFCLLFTFYFWSWRISFPAVIDFDRSLGEVGYAAPLLPYYSTAALLREAAVLQRLRQRAFVLRAGAQHAEGVVDAALQVGVPAEGRGRARRGTVLGLVGRKIDRETDASARGEGSGSARGERGSCLARRGSTAHARVSQAKRGA